MTQSWPIRPLLGDSVCRRQFPTTTIRRYSVAFGRFVRYAAFSELDGRGFRKSVYKFFQGNQIVLEIGVDDFVKHHKRVAQDAVKAANKGVVKLEAVHRDREQKAAEDEKARLTATERERQKARRVKFD